MKRSLLCTLDCSLVDYTPSLLSIEEPSALRQVHLAFVTRARVRRFIVAFLTDSLVHHMSKVTVARVRFEPTTLRFYGKNPTTIPPDSTTVHILSVRTGVLRLIALRKQH